MRNLKLMAAILSTVVVVACQSLYTGTVTLTDVVDSAAKEYAHLYNSGLVPADVAARASAAFAQYQKAASVAHDALVAVKLGQTADGPATLDAARQAAREFISALTPLLAKNRVTQLTTQLSKATII